MKELYMNYIVNIVESIREWNKLKDLKLIEWSFIDNKMVGNNGDTVASGFHCEYIAVV